MEDQIKIFVVGLRVYSKMKGHRISQTALAKSIGKTQPTISDYFNEKYFPDMPEIQKWIKDFNLDFEEMLTIGRQELQPKTTELTGEDVKKIVDGRLTEILQTQSLPAEKSNVMDLSDPVKIQHYKKVNEFIDKRLALKLNSLAVELERKDPIAYKEIIELMEFKLSKKEDIKPGEHVKKASRK